VTLNIIEKPEEPDKKKTHGEQTKARQADTSMVSKHKQA
jgi:hypothetical protein